MAATRVARRIGTALMGAGALFGALAGVGAAYQAINVARERRIYPPPGRLVDIGGYRLHITDEGQSAPTVVFDAGLAGLSLDWALVRPEVARFTRVCTYDRAGYGWSDRGARPRNSLQIAMELRALLRRANIPGPYVLVGHSFGGFNVRVFADRYPSEVAGMVQVDASHEDFVPRLSARARDYYLNIERLEAPLLALGSAFSRVGVVRLLGDIDTLALVLKVFEALPPGEREMAKVLRYHTAFFDTSRDEVKSFYESAEQAHRTASLGDKPVIVLTAVGQDTGQNEIGETMVPGLNIDLKSIEEMVMLRATLHAELAHTLSTNSAHIVTRESGHLIAITQPQLIIDSVRQVVESVRAGNKPLMQAIPTSVSAESPDAAAR